MCVTLVRSECNKADHHTRVPAKWLNRHTAMYAAAEDKFDLKSLHKLHHFGVDRTLYLVKVCNPDDARKEVESCIKCKSVDPSTVHWEKGNLDVELNWDRIACDVTHYQGNIHLTMIDCGMPSGGKLQMKRLPIS